MDRQALIELENTSLTSEHDCAVLDRILVAVLLIQWQLKIV